jgi:cytochrome P450
MLTVTEAMFFLNTVLQGGNESSTSLIGSIVHSLLEHPDQLALLIDDPGLIPRAVDETLRYRSPIQFLFRKTNVDVEIADTTIPKGEVVVIIWAAANTDPRQYDHPERFDITREATPHLGFGLGPHFCLGAQLARMEGQVALRAILPHLPNFELGQAVLTPTPLVYGHERLELIRK